MKTMQASDATSGRRKPTGWITILVIAAVLAQFVAGCGGAPTEEAAPVETQAPVVEPTAEPTTPPEPVDIVLWAQATVTEAGPPPDDWIAYDVIRETLGINLTYVILPTGSDGEAVLNAADRVKADAIVVGTSGKTAIDRVLIGSVSEYIVRNSKCTVIVVK